MKSTWGKIRRLLHLEKSAISHGNTVAFQTDVNTYWLGCAGALICGQASCPGNDMSGSDWHRCWGEVFEIYREKGPGYVRVGDRVGLHYPHEHGRWLGCDHGKRCGKASCPGYNIRYGFESYHHWYDCWGEVFIIYAIGKSHGAVINSDDKIALFYKREGAWVTLGYRPYAFKLHCSGIGCHYGIFHLWKRPY